ncbi:hypothetical protein P7C73_g4882, partial [Tremellales sp. Uapishka_1]
MSTSRGRLITLENFIIDTFTRVGEDGIERAVSQPDQIGGGGTYAIVGARLFLPPEKLGMLVEYSPSTLDASMRARLNAMGEDMWEYVPWPETCRSVNRYRGQDRFFEYLTAPNLHTPLSLQSTRYASPPPALLHFITYPDRSAQILDEIRQLGWRDTQLIWEPEPHSCIPANLEAIRDIASEVHILSPNHTEALALLSRPLPDESATATLTACCRSLPLARTATIIRAGALGACYILAAEPGTVHWVPAYYSASEAEHVVDPTGAGNAFMGGLGAALYEGLDVHQAVLWGTVAASFVIQQDGLPHFQSSDRRETWNGETGLERLEKLKAKIKT